MNLFVGVHVSFHLCLIGTRREEVVEKGLVIQEKEKLYNELKAILARQPVL